MSDVLVLSHADVHAALAPEACERAMAEVLIAQSTGAAYAPLRNVMMPPGAPGFMGLMPAYARDDEDGGFALKAICLMPGNPARGLDSHQGTVTLFDGFLTLYLEGQDDEPPGAAETRSGIGRPTTRLGQPTGGT